MVGGGVQVILAVATAIAGVLLASAGMLGYFSRPLGWFMRVFFLVAGLSLLIPAEAFAGAVYIDVSVRSLVASWFPGNCGAIEPQAGGPFERDVVSQGRPQPGQVESLL